MGQGGVDDAGQTRDPQDRAVHGGHPLQRPAARPGLHGLVDGAGDQVGGPQHREPIGGDLTDDADRQAGPGEGLAADDLFRQAQLAAHRAHLVLKE